MQEWKCRGIGGESGEARCEGTFGTRRMGGRRVVYRPGREPREAQYSRDHHSVKTVARQTDIFRDIFLLLICLLTKIEKKKEESN